MIPVLYKDVYYHETHLAVIGPLFTLTTDLQHAPPPLERTRQWVMPFNYAMVALGE